MPLSDCKNDRYSVKLATEVCQEHGEYIQAVIDFRVRDKCLSADLFQDFFLHLVANPIPEDVENKRGYLYKTILNYLSNAQRRIQRYHDRIARYAEMHRQDQDENSIANIAHKLNDIDDLLQVINNQLPPSHAQAVTLRYKENYSMDEVAGVMGIEKKSVSRYLSVGLQKLRKILVIERGGKNDRP